MQNKGDIEKYLNTLNKEQLEGLKTEIENNIKRENKKKNDSERLFRIEKRNKKIKTENGSETVEYLTVKEIKGKVVVLNEEESREFAKSFKEQYINSLKQATSYTEFFGLYSKDENKKNINADNMFGYCFYPQLVFTKNDVKQIYNMLVNEIPMEEIIEYTKSNKKSRLCVLEGAPIWFYGSYDAFGIDNLCDKMNKNSSIALNFDAFISEFENEGFKIYNRNVNPSYESFANTYLNNFREIYFNIVDPNFECSNTGTMKYKRLSR